MVILPLLDTFSEFNEFHVSQPGRERPFNLAPPSILQLPSSKPSPSSHALLLDELFPCLDLIPLLLHLYIPNSNSSYSVSFLNHPQQSSSEFHWSQFKFYYLALFFYTMILIYSTGLSFQFIFEFLMPAAEPEICRNARKYYLLF